MTKSPRNSPEIGVSDREDSRITPHPVWPTVIGALSVGIAFINLLPCVLCFAVFIAQPDDVDPPFVCLSIPVGIMGSLGLWAGIALLQRRLLARRCSLAYGWATILTSGLLSLILGLSTRDMGTQLSVAGTIELVGTASWGSWHVLNAAYGVFLLVWFCRPTIKRQVDTWAHNTGRTR